MPDAITHSQFTAPIAAGAVSTAIGWLFGIQTPILLAAFIGSWVGAACLPKMKFTRALIQVCTSTTTAAYLVGILIQAWPNYSQRAISFIAGFAIIYFHDFILTQSKDAIARVIGKVGS